MAGRRIPVALFGSALLIVLLHFLFHPVRVLGMTTSIFYMDEEITLAAWFQQVVAFTTGLLALYQVLPALKDKKEKLLTAGFGLFFIVLSFDEYFSIHEYINTVVKETLKTGSLFGNLAQLSWIFPLSGVITIVFALFIMQIIREPIRTVRKWLMVGILSYVGVILFEFLGSLTYGNSIYVLFVGLEEGLEMIGGVAFLASVLCKIESLQKNQRRA